MLKRLLLASVCASILAVPAANAMQLRYEYRPNYMVVFVTGDIEAGDDTRFIAYTKNQSPGRVSVVLNSNGGNLIAGLNIGIHIHNK